MSAGAGPSDANGASSETERWYLPPEWAPHAATWLSWPHNRDDWPGKMVAVTWAFAEIVRALTTVGEEHVHLIVRDARHEAAARRDLTRAGVDLAKVETFTIPTDRGWCRDCGPMFLRRGRPAGPIAIGDFGFTGWAKYDNYRLDDQVPARASQALGVERVEPTAGGRRFVLEGGAIEVNGAGTSLTTSECVLDCSRQPRNAHLGQADLEAALARWLGIDRVIYLPRGIAGDDTGGHIDDLARFAGPRTIAVCDESDEADVNHAPCREACQALAAARLADGTSPTIVTLPMPRPLFFEQTRLPASYANFYIANAAVLVPTFNDPADRVALSTLAALFPDRQVVGIHAVDLVWGLGTIHCLTQQQPRP